MIPTSNVSSRDCVDWVQFTDRVCRSVDESVFLVDEVASLEAAAENVIGPISQAVNLSIRVFAPLRNRWLPAELRELLRLKHKARKRVQTIRSPRDYEIAFAMNCYHTRKHDGGVAFLRLLPATVHFGGFLEHSKERKRALIRASHFRKMPVLFTLLRTRHLLLTKM